MLRRVNFLKSISGGVCGAFVWELAARAAVLAGLPVLDITHSLGTLMLGDVPFWQWWPIGMALHAMVGAIWATFYAYLFWSMFRYRPVIQGILFSFIPMLLAGLIMTPQIGWMHPQALNGEIPKPGVFGIGLGWGGPAGVILGHLIFGAVLGAIYVRPVGYPVGRRVMPHA